MCSCTAWHRAAAPPPRRQSSTRRHRRAARPASATCRSAAWRARTGARAGVRRSASAAESRRSGASAAARRREASGPGRRIKGMVIVLGIDPGTANLGYGVVLARGRKLAALDGGVVTAPASEPLERRLARIHARLCDLIGEHKPSAVAVEDVFFGQNARSAFAGGKARGGVRSGGGLRGL